MGNHKEYMTVGEVAKKMGITVRALQYYDRKGLLCPSLESEGGRRLYSDKDIVNLHQILTFKSLGFSLCEIKYLLTDIDTPEKAVTALTKQSDALKDKIADLSKSLQTIEALKSEVKQMQTVDFKKYADIIINLQMDNKHYRLIKYFDDSTLDYCHKRFDKESGPAFINKFKALTERAEQCVESGFAYDSEQGQQVAKEFWELIMEFMDGDISLLPQLIKMGNSEFENEKLHNTINSFIKPALGVYFDKLGINPFEANKKA